MAKLNHSVVFKNASIDLEDGTITEIKKDTTETYRLLDELRKFEGEGRLVDLTIKEVTDLTPVE